MKGNGFADRMVFSNKVRFPWTSPEKEAAPDFVGVAKITAPGAAANPSAPSSDAQVATFKLHRGVSRVGVRRLFHDWKGRLEKGGRWSGGRDQKR